MPPRLFADRPVAWDEGDTRPIARPPKPRATMLATRGIDDVARLLGGQPRTSAEDVNSLDEVPCSSWFCPRNHLQPMTPSQVALGSPGGEPPVLPLTIVKGKLMGVTPGFIATDARGHKYNVKFDPPGYPRLMSGAEVVGSRLMYAAGYDTAPNFPITVAASEIAIDPEAKISIGGKKRRFTAADLAGVLRRAALDGRGRYVGVAVSWIPGDGLGGFLMAGRRADDPNDLIPHERRRSLRATRVMFAWLNIHDADVSNWLDSWVTDGAHSTIRHVFIDFGGGLGASNTHADEEWSGSEGVFELGRTLHALFALGGWHRRWQEQRGRRDAMVRRYPSLGWMQSEGWDPNGFRTNVPVVAQTALTERDGYWGAKLVTSFTDAQLRAAVDAAGYPPDAAAELVRILRVRRDLVGRRWLRASTAVEAPEVTANGEVLCFDDLALRRGAARPVELVYEITLRDDTGRALRRDHAVPTGVHTCIAAGARSAYRIVEVRARVAGKAARAAYVHVAWSARRHRFAVLGVDRDE